MPNPALPPERFTVDLAARRYDILLGHGLLAQADALIAENCSEGRTLIITDEEVAKLHLASLPPALRAEGPIILPAGEASKGFATLERLCETLLDLRVDRRTRLLALGGGVIGDVVGFAAAITLRGLDFIQVPTTLLAQVDSAVGGKTGINTRQGKNLVGSFHQPRLVIIDTDTLRTLAPRDRRAGYAEIVKYGLLGDADFFAWCEENGARVLALEPAPLRHAVRTSLACKAAIVRADEREETGLRALLNLGHSFGHALEAEAGYGGRLLHGEAVAMGCALAFGCSAARGFCPPSDAARVAAHLTAMGFDLDWRAISPPDRLLQHMMQDKKNEAGMLTLILARGIGKAFVEKRVPADLLRQFLESAAARFAGGEVAALNKADASKP